MKLGNKSLLLPIISMMMLSGCNNNEIKTYNTETSFNLTSLELISDTSETGSKFKQITISWDEPTFNGEYCNYEGDSCYGSTPVYNFCYEDLTKSNSCNIVKENINNYQENIDLYDVHIGVNPKFFIQAVYNHGVYNTNQISLTPEQANDLTLKIMNPLSNISGEFSHAVAISGDGNYLISSDVDVAGGSTAYVYIYKKTEDGFTQIDSMEQPDLTAGFTNFGDYVGISDDGKYVIISEEDSLSCSNDLNALDQLCSSNKGSFIVGENDGTDNYNFQMVIPDKSLAGVYTHIENITISGDGKTIVVPSYDDDNYEVIVRFYQKDNSDGIWKESHHFVHSFHYNSNIKGLDISYDGKTVVYNLGEEMTVVLKNENNVASIKQQIINEILVGAEYLEGLAISSDGKVIIVGIPGLELGYDEGEQGIINIYRLNELTNRFTFIESKTTKNLDRNSELGKNISTNYDGSIIVSSVEESILSNQSGTQLFDMANAELEWRHGDSVGAVVTYKLNDVGTYDFSAYTFPQKDIDYMSNYSSGGFKRERSLDLSNSGTLVVGASELKNNSGDTMGGIFIH